MAVIAKEVLKCDFVLLGYELLRRPEEHSEFQARVGTEVVSAGTGVLVGANPIPNPRGLRSLGINRDRITLQLSAERSVVQKDYPSSMNDLARLAEVAGLAMATTDLTNQELIAYGFNFELVYDQDSGSKALNYLGNRLFSPDLPSMSKWSLVGGSGKLSFQDQDKRKSWNIIIDPRFNDPNTTKIFVSFNLHINRRVQPNNHDIELTLQKIWEVAEKFITTLDQSRT